MLKNLSGFLQIKYENGLKYFFTFTTRLGKKPYFFYIKKISL